MDDDSCSKFIGSLTKYLQSLCHSYVDFDTGVELVGHIYLNVDTGKKIDYVLNESVCKNGANVVKFTSNSYHAQPVEKQKKDTPKKAPDPPKSTDSRKKNDDDDVIIVGSEGSRRNRTGSSPSRSLASSNQMQRGAVAGQHRLAQQQAGMFRHPRGPNPRLGTPVPRGGYTYQPRQRLTYPQQPRNFLNVGAGYSPRMRQPQYPQPRGTQPMGVRGTGPIDTDVTFMREEYVAGQPNNRTGTQPAVTAAGQQPSYPYQAAPHQMQQQSHLQHYMPPYTQATSVTTGMALPLTAGTPTSLGVGMATGSSATVTSTMTTEQPMVSGEENSGTTGSPMFQPVASVSVSGGMPLPVTTHTIFDSGPVMTSADMPSGQQQIGGVDEVMAGPVSSGSDPLAATMTTDNVTGVSAASVTSVTSPSLLIGQVWSESSANPSTSQAQPLPSSAGNLSYPQMAQPGLSTASVPSLPESSDTDSSGHSGNMFEVFNQQPPAHTQAAQPPHSSPFSPSQSSTMSQSAASSAAEGDKFSALVSELKAFNQQPSSHPHPSTLPPDRSTHPPNSSPTAMTFSFSALEGPSEGSSDPASARPMTITVGGSGTPVKMDPGDLTANVVASMLQESRGAEGNETSETFLAPANAGNSQGSFHGGLEEYRKRSGSSSSHSQGTPSPNSSSLVGPESVVIETKPFLQHTSDYDSGCDSASASTGERLASPQGQPLSSSHTQLRSLSIPSSSAKSVDVKQERPSEDDEQIGTVKRAESEWVKSATSDWVTDMSALNNSDDSMDSASDTAQDDDDPNYTPGRPIATEKGSVKRTRSKQHDKGSKGKKRRFDATDSADEADEQSHPSLNLEVTPESDVQQPSGFSPPLETEEQQGEEASGDTVYKPGTFILVNVYKDSERSIRTRPLHTPAEVIVTPAGEMEGVWVHILVPAGNGLWRLPSVDQLVDTKMEPYDIVKTLNHANVKIVGTKVFYKFDDM